MAFNPSRILGFDSVTPCRSQDLQVLETKFLPMVHRDKRRRCSKFQVDPLSGPYFTRWCVITPYAYFSGPPSARNLKLLPEVHLSKRCFTKF